MGEMNDSKTYVGVDPGKSGAMAIIMPDGTVRFKEYTGPLCYRETIREIAGRPHSVVVERLFARPGKMSSAKANFELGRCVGELEAVFGMLGVGFQAVTPQTWQKEFGISGDKRTHVQMARQLFPGVSLKRTEKCKVDFDGFADALLMALFGKRKGF